MPEIVASITVSDPKSLVSFPAAREMFQFAIKHVMDHRHDEYKTCWGNIEKASKSEVNLHWFLREFLWCVYVSGFSAKTISKKYDALLVAHGIEDSSGGFLPIDETNIDGRIDRVLSIFKNKRKAESVQAVRKMIYRDGWDEFLSKYARPRDPKVLEELPGIGPALACHLARNLGNVNICKPDVHLKRVAAHYGFDSVESLCRGVATDSPVGHTDLILWMAAIDNSTQ